MQRWINMSKQSKDCQHAKRNYHGQPAPLHPLPVAAVFQRWHMDFLGPLKKAEGGEQYILLIVDSFSRWCEAFALIDQKISRMFPHQLVHALVVGLHECLEAGLEGLLLHRQHVLKCQLLLIQNIVDNSVDVGVLGV